MSYEQSIAGLEKELRFKVMGNMVRNPFFAYDPTGLFAANWTNVSGATASSISGTPGTPSHALVMPSGGIVDSDWIVVNSGQDSLDLPNFTFTIYSQTTNPPPITLIITVMDHSSNVLATINCTPGNTLTLESHSVELPNGISRVKLRFTAPAGTTTIRFVSLVPGDSQPAYFAPHAFTDEEALEFLNLVAPLGHHHAISDVTGLQSALDTLEGEIETKAPLVHNHDTVYHKKTGDETHHGIFKVDTAPVDLTDVVRLLELNNISDALNSNITLGPGSTSNSGYAYLGTNLTLAWKRGPSTWFSGTTNPVVNLQLPLTFSTVYTYALSTENTEDSSAISDNDAWFQMVSPPLSGNTFPVIAQCVGGNLGGYIAPMLWVLGSPAPHNITITTTGWSGMAAHGQVSPKIVTFQLLSTGGLGTITWDITGFTGLTNVVFVDGSTDLLRVTIPSSDSFATTVNGTISVTATDSTATVASRVLNVQVTPYTQVPLVITQSDTSRITDTYPFNPSLWIANAYTGGTAPITWSLLTPDSGTPLPSAAISGGSITGSVSSPGTYTIKLQATDSDPVTPQVVTKQFTLTVTTYVAPPSSYCFEEDTFVLMSDWTAKEFASVVPGDMILSIAEMNHERNARVIQPCMVTDVMRVPGRGDEADSVIIGGVKATPGHAFAFIESNGKGGWVRAADIPEDTQIVTIKDKLPTAAIAGQVSRDTPVKVAMNLGCDLHTYFVGPTENGPWMLVHNTTYTSY